MHGLVMKPIKTVPLAISLTRASGVFAPADPPDGKPGDIPAPGAGPAFSPGLVNEWLRNQSPAFKPWDFGGQFRARYEVKENGGSSRGAAAHIHFLKGAGDNERIFIILSVKNRIF